ncbi:hypothetical protein [Bacillus phage vB_BanS-Thrax5]|nr:hypothetical protein [Bacillus phage vB_BanS-Thrax5]
MDMINDLLGTYKKIIDFNDKMQKDNYKFVERYISYQMKKNRQGWRRDCIDFLDDAIDVHLRFLGDRIKIKSKGL